MQTEVYFDVYFMFYIHWVKTGRPFTVTWFTSAFVSTCFCFGLHYLLSDIFGSHPFFKLISVFEIKLEIKTGT